MSEVKAFYDGNGQLRMAVLEEGHRAEVHQIETKVAALEAENSRLKAPFTDEDIDDLFAASRDGKSHLRHCIEYLLTHRAQQQPSPAQDKGAAMEPPVIHVVTPESSSGKLWEEVQRLQAVEAESARTIAHLNQAHREVSEMEQGRIEELEKALTYIAKFADSMRKLGTAGLSPANLQDTEPGWDVKHD